MRKRGEINGTAEFYSPQKHQWCALSGILQDVFPAAAKVARLRAIGIREVKLAGSFARACRACKDLAEHTYAIDAVPALPPPNCRCVPWCRLYVMGQG